MTARSDEGMWLFNHPPREILKSKYGFSPEQAWLDHLQRASVRFNSGGSGAFVSSHGLVITNHHVGADAIQKLSRAEKNYLEEGFFAEQLEQELPCVDLELNVLESIEVVTDRVHAAVVASASPEASFIARRQVIAEIEKESLDQTGLRSNVITLYQGGEYHLYRFRRYTDVRLVFAPEQQAAFFGGDPDNFEYPRYCLDVCFFRVFEGGKPIAPPAFLRWSSLGAKPGELVFVSGHPGRTNRLNTMAELEYLRDCAFPQLLDRLRRLEVLLAAYSSHSQEHARQARDELFSIQNSRKARSGGLAGLLDPNLLARKQAEETQFQVALRGHPEYGNAIDACQVIAKVQHKRTEIARPYTVLEGGAGFNTIYFTIARSLLRAVIERQKPNGERLREFQDSNLESLEQQLFSEQPIYDRLEVAKLEDSLTFLLQEFGFDHPLANQILAGKSPRQRADDLIQGTRLKDIASRQRIYGGDPELLRQVDDPMIELARIVDPEARRLRKIYETEIEEVKRQAYAKIAEARYAIEGTNTYPDATFTLRLAFGQILGYCEHGQDLPPFTTYAGLYERAECQQGQPPFHLSSRWQEAKQQLDLHTPFNFVCTADIIGGNSGSPVVNQHAEIVGLIFDGNIDSLVLDFIYTADRARAICVDSRGIVHALQKIYQAHRVVDELTTPAD